jgi:hypothetical protein
MSRNLPARPNLEYLKKEAKERLDVLRRRDPAAQLADAQHDLAKEYGFASWPQLKAHVEGAVALAHPLAGRWIANLSLSVRHPANPFQRATIVFAVTGAQVDIADEFVDEAGGVLRNRQAILADGVAHEMANGYVLTASWRSARVLETVAAKNGAEVGRGTYEVSADGRRLTITSADQVIVLDRAIA